MESRRAVRAARSTAEYGRRHRLEQVFAALLSALAVVRPDDLLTFAIEKLRLLQGLGDCDLSWDVFIDEKFRPKRNLLAGGIARTFLDDETDLVNLDAYKTAFEFYYRKLLEKSFRNWQKFVCQKKENRQKLEERMEEVRKWRKEQRKKIIVRMWMKITQQNSQIRKAFTARLGRFKVKWNAKRLFSTWREAVAEAREEQKLLQELSARLSSGESCAVQRRFLPFLFKQSVPFDKLGILPAEVAIRILGQLDVADRIRASRVSSNWKMLVNSEKIWQKLDLSAPRQRLSERAVERLLLSFYQWIRHLNLRRCRITGRVSRALRSCSHLQDLNLSECRSLTDAELAGVLESCPLLISLNLSHTRISDRSLASISQFATNLRHLSIAGCAAATDCGLGLLAKGTGIGQLRQLDISACSKVSASGLARLFASASGVVSLKINGLGAPDDFLCTLVVLPHLADLQALRTQFATPEVTKEEMFRLPALKRLNLKGSDWEGSGALKKLLRSCRQLEALCLSDCRAVSDRLLAGLAASRQLTSLNLNNCYDLSDDGFRCLGDLPLRELYVSNCVQLGDRSAVRIAARYPDVTYLDVSFCRLITPAGLALIGRNLRRLADVDFSATQCDDEVLGSLGKVGSLSLSDCPAVSDAGLQQFLHPGEHFLRRLDISFCPNLSNNSLVFLCKSCPLLDFLGVAGNAQMDLRSLVVYLSSSSLRTLKVCETKVRTLQKHFRNIQFLSSETERRHENIL